jgi:hypothetical protein
MKRVEGDVPAHRDELVVEVGFTPAIADVPLAAGDDLEGLVAALVEVGHCLVGVGSPSKSPLARSASTMAARALKAVLPASCSAYNASPGVPPARPGSLAAGGRCG